MADLLTASDWLDFRGAIQDVTETFFDQPLALHFRGDLSTKKLTAFNESRAKGVDPIDIFFSCLNVPRSSYDDAAKSTIKQKGFMDDSEGYVLLRFVDLKNLNTSLINVSILAGQLLVDNANDPDILLTLVNGVLKKDGLTASRYTLTNGILYYQNPTIDLITMDNRCTLAPNRDSITVLGEELDIMGVNLVGPTETDYQLVKLHYKKKLNI